jgi:hypothetical protein
LSRKPYRGAADPWRAGFDAAAEQRPHSNYLLLSASRQAYTLLKHVELKTRPAVQNKQRSHPWLIHSNPNPLGRSVQQGCFKYAVLFGIGRQP